MGSGLGPYCGHFKGKGSLTENRGQSGAGWLVVEEMGAKMRAVFGRGCNKAGEERGSRKRGSASTYLPYTPGPHGTPGCPSAFGAA